MKKEGRNQAKELGCVLLFWYNFCERKKDTEQISIFLLLFCMKRGLGSSGAYFFTFSSQLFLIARQRVRVCMRHLHNKKVSAFYWKIVLY